MHGYSTVGMHTTIVAFLLTYQVNERKDSQANRNNSVLTFLQYPLYFPPFSS